MKLKNVALLLFTVCLCVFLWMGYKLYTMTQIRGWTSGTRTVSYVVTQRYVEPSRRLTRDDAYWVSWSTTVDIKTPGNHRIGVPAEKYNNYYIGAPIEIVYVGNDETPYMRDGIYASDGNFVFDVSCLFIMLIGALVLGYYYLTEKQEIRVR